MKKAEKLLELDGQGLSIWKINLDSLREQDLNARYMNEDKFKLLSETIKRDKRLESLPFVAPSKRKGEFEIISGHHRTRAARMAGVKKIYCLVEDKELPKDWVKSKQLSHNALQGMDDNQLLAEIYTGIEDLNARIFSGISEDEVLQDFQPININELNVDLRTRLVTIIFTQKGFDDFDEAISLIEESDEIFIDQKKAFYKFIDTAKRVSKKENVRNISGIIFEMCRIVKLHYAKDEENNKK